MGTTYLMLDIGAGEGIYLNFDNFVRQVSGNTRQCEGGGGSLLAEGAIAKARVVT